MSSRTLLVVGGTSGIGLEVARAARSRGDEVVITGRDEDRAVKVAETLGEGVRGLGLDLAEPTELAARLEDVERVDGLVLSAVERDQNAIDTYDIAGAMRLVTLKLVGYTEVVHALLPRMPASADTSIVVFGGRAKDRPYPGSTTVSTVNGGVDGLVRTLALQLAPIRINALHPGIVSDSPFWAGKPPTVLDAYRARTPAGELATMADVVDAVEFLLRNRAMTAASLYVDCGWEVT
jgi:NAD(P)-dependent dehydrogenase (short-subunit alcohol dehydrogenase family)